MVGWLSILFDSFYVNFPLLKPPWTFLLILPKCDKVAIFVGAKLVLFNHKADVFIHDPKTK